MIRKLLAAVAGSILTAFVLVMPATPAGAVPAEEPMTEAKAGTYFLRHVCVSNRANDRMNRIVYGRDGWITRAEVRRRFTDVKAATRVYARYYYNLSRAMMNPPAPWPDSVDGPAETMARNLLRVHALIQRAGNAYTPQGWLNLMGRAHKVPLPFALIRARLEVPPPGEGC